MGLSQILNGQIIKDIRTKKSRLPKKSCADRLKKKTDETNSIKAKLQQLARKESKSFMQTDLEVIVYDKKMSASLFVNTHYQET